VGRAIWSKPRSPSMKTSAGIEIKLAVERGPRRIRMSGGPARPHARLLRVMAWRTAGIVPQPKVCCRRAPGAARRRRFDKAEDPVRPTVRTARSPPRAGARPSPSSARHRLRARGAAPNRSPACRWLRPAPPPPIPEPEDQLIELGMSAGRHPADSGSQPQLGIPFRGVLIIEVRRVRAAGTLRPPPRSLAGGRPLAGQVDGVDAPDGIAVPKWCR
jgi:hypothetical protein